MFVEEVNRGPERMSNDKVTYITLMTSELLKLRGPQIGQCITIITHEALRRWTHDLDKPIHKQGDKKLVPN
mgnify:FL=1